MTRSDRNIIIIVITIAFALVGGVAYLITSFLSALAPAEITITKTEIETSRGFYNPVTIEKLTVDSIGAQGTPVKYVIDYLTTCAIKNPAGRPPVSLGKIKLNKAGRYTWSPVEDVNIPVVHEGLSRQRRDSIQGIIWSMESRRLDICPLTFEPGNWYFVTFHDPQIVGAYIFIDNQGNLRQYMAYSGVCPI